MQYLQVPKKTKNKKTPPNKEKNPKLTREKCYPSLPASMQSRRKESTFYQKEHLPTPPIKTKTPPPSKASERKAEVISPPPCSPPQLHNHTKGLNQSPVAHVVRCWVCVSILPPKVSSLVISALTGKVRKGKQWRIFFLNTYLSSLTAGQSQRTEVQEANLPIFLVGI